MEGPIKNEENKPKDNLESRLNPEVLEKVMGKIKDVMRKGTALSIVRKNAEAVGPKGDLQSLASVLELGLLGTDHTKSKHVDMDDMAKEWAEQSRKERDDMVWANIMDRDKWENLKNIFASCGDFGILFSLDSFKEHAPFAGGHNEESFKSSVKKAKTRTYRANTEPFWYIEGFDFRKMQEILIELGLNGVSIEFPEYLEKFKNSRQALINHGIPENIVNQMMQEVENAENYEELFGNPRTDNGFIITRRVAPRNFIGIFLTSAGTKLDNLVFKEKEEDINSRIEGVIETMKQVSEKIGTDRYYPVYDTTGNLLWPKKMSYEEVKKLVEEREKEKKDEK